MKLEKYFDLCLNLDLKLNEGSSGKYNLFSDVNKKGSDFMIIPQSYEVYLRGYELRKITLDKDYTKYDLFRDSERLMSNGGSEIFEQYIPFVRAKGHVLVGGLGLGFYAQLACMKDNVNKVTVIELSEDVIKLCGFENEKFKIINDDFYSFIRNNDLNKYNYIYDDTYTMGKEIYPQIVIPTRNYLLEKYPTIPFDFWHDDELKAHYLFEMSPIK